MTNRSGNDENQNRLVRVYHTETTYDIGVTLKSSPQWMTGSH